MSVLHFQKVGSSCLFELKRENQDQGCLWNTFTQVPQGFTFPMQFIPELEKMKKRQFAHQMVFMAENNNTSFKLFNSYFDNKSTNEKLCFFSWITSFHEASSKRCDGQTHLGANTVMTHFQICKLLFSVYIAEFEFAHLTTALTAQKEKMK